jgi:hypothetical protein
MNLMRRTSLAIIALLITAVPAAAQGLDAPGLSGFRPEVPVSAFARPAAWFDPSRLHVSTTVSVGSGFGGTSDALQVTSFNYAFAAPLRMQVSLGNTWGTGEGNGTNFFLEGLALDYRPSASTSIRIQYRNFRSPLQYGGFGHGYGNGYGYGSDSGPFGGY